VACDRRTEGAKYGLPGRILALFQTAHYGVAGSSAADLAGSSAADRSANVGPRETANKKAGQPACGNMEEQFCTPQYRLF
jgi:hypothetical protein